MNNIRKKNTGEPGNGGEFGSAPRLETEVGLDWDQTDPRGSFYNYSAGDIPRRHEFLDFEDCYTQTQVTETIKDGDILVVTDYETGKPTVGFLNQAWPVAVHGEPGGLHTADREALLVEHPQYAEIYQRCDEIARDLDRERAASLPDFSHLDAADALRWEETAIVGIDVGDRVAHDGEVKTVVRFSNHSQLPMLTFEDGTRKAHNTKFAMHVLRKKANYGDAPEQDA